MGNNNSGTNILLFLSLFNLVALTCVIVYNVKYTHTDVYKDNSRESIFREITDDISALFKGKSRRSIEQNGQMKNSLELENILKNEKVKLLDECRTVAKEEVVKLLKEAATYLQPLDVETKQKRQTNTAGNELANIFGEIAKTEVDILTQYCGNNSHICLPGEKGAKGDSGLKGDQGSTGIQGTKGDTGVNGLKGDTGLSGPQGPPGTKGDLGSKGEPGLYGVPGSKGQRGVMGPQGLKGDTGVNGLKGDTGLPGAQGPSGIKGDLGSKGEPGLYGVPGSKGQRGVMGPQGSKGDMGHVGIKGDKGDTGLTGTNGVQGMAGPKGDKGDPADTTLLQPVPQCCTSLSVPKFTEQLQELRVTEGSNVTLDCNPSGYPAPSLTWTPDPFGLNLPRTKLTPSSLTITDVHVVDSQTFTCLAQNAIGASQKNYVLKVYQHLKFDKLPQNYTVMTGNPVTLECQIEGPLDPKITWYKVMPDGSKAVVTNGDITTAQNVSRLHFDHVNSATEGTYLCEGHNGVENVQMSANLKTYGPPHIRPHGPVNVLKGQSARLTCDADAEPPATITWTYPPGVTNAYVDTDGSLVIMNANSRDSKYFICTAKNQYGSDQTQITVNVKYPPEVTLTPQKIAVDSGKTTIALQCTAQGDSPLSVSWFKDGFQITGNSHVFVLPGNVLLINQANVADLGQYTCRASNSLGAATATSFAYKDAGNIQCSTTFAVCTEPVCSAVCPPSCTSDPTPTIQLGTVYYTQTSSICKAALLSKMITDSGGQVLWRNSGFRAELLNANQSPTP